MLNVNLRELVNYRHPGPRRVWKVGSELQSTTLDPLDPRDPRLCPKVWFRVRETILFALWPASRVRGTKYLVLSTKYLVLSTKYLVLGTKYLK